MSGTKEISNNTNQTVRPLLVFLFLAVGTLIGTSINKEKKDKFSQILNIVQNDYVDSTNEIALREDAIRYLLSQLDPHSSYIPPSLSEISSRQIRGNYEGLGIEYLYFRDTLFVYNIFPGSPALLAGVKAGDRLLKSNSIVLTDTMNEDLIQKSFEKKPVQLEIYRRSDHSYQKISLKKGEISINSSSTYYMVDNSLGYIKIERFSSQTHKEFLNSLNQLKSKGLKDLIIDLRDNGGGLLGEAVAIANEFLEKDAMITYTEGNKRTRRDFIADGNGVFKEGKLIILINQNTASASEILSGCLQDNDRAVIIGSRTFGKGLVQEPFRLPDGSTLRLTTARYYTPSGRSIQKTYTKNIELYRSELFSRDVLSDTLNPVFDSTTRKDFFSLNGRLLTYGGGIRPDIIMRDVDKDSTDIEKIAQAFRYSRILDIYLLDFMSNDLVKIKTKYPNSNDFIQNYQIESKQIQNVYQYLKHIPYLKNIRQQVKINDLINKQLKRVIAFRLYGENGSSLLSNLQDGIFSKSFEVLKNYNKLLNIGPKKSHRFDY
ncbi:MAG: S41 family peptidase [Bacteroidota bacterium]|nr:S41 family peptidase [Bacteroidota bacterium]